MFNFLNPAVLFALAAGLIPLLIHLFNRRKNKQIQFSTIHFLKQMAKKEMRRLRMRQILLLIIRTLIVLLLVLVFARPTLPTTGNLLAGRSAAEVVVIIDNSLSLNRLELTGNLLEKVKQRWLNLETVFSPGDRISVVLGVTPLRVLAERESYNPALWPRVSKEIEPGYLTGNMNDALLTAADIFRSSDLYNQEIYIISDFQAGNWRNFDETAADDLFDRPVTVFALPVFAGESENLSVDSAGVVNQLIEKNQRLNVTALFSNHHDSKHLTSLLSLVFGDNRVAQRNESFAPQETRQIRFETTLQRGGFINGYVECEGDALLEDNRFFFNFFVPENINILHLSSSGSEGGFLPLVLKPAVEKDLFVYEHRNINEWPGIDFFKFKTVILDGVNQVPEGLQNRLKQMVERGSGLIIVPGDQLAPAGINPLIRDLELGVVLDRRGDPASAAQFVTMGKVNWSHRIFEGLFDSQPNLNPVDFSAYYKIKPLNNSETVIQLQNGDPLLISSTGNMGAVYLLASPLEREWTNLMVRGFVVPFFYRMVYDAVTRGVVERIQLFTGETFSRTFRMVQPPYEFTLKEPSGTTVKLSPVFKGPDVLLETPPNKLPGNYEIRQGNQLLSVYSVNHSPLESESVYMQKGDLEDLFPRLIWLEQTNELGKQIERSRFGLELWPYLLAAVLLLLGLEMVLARTSARGELKRTGEELAHS
ncbi:MAG: BatA domain-containing protein [Calditrichia bacterium]